VTRPALRRAAATLGLLASLAGLPVLLRAATDPPSLGGLPSGGWVREVVRDQYLPLDPVAHLLGTLAWGLWAYAVVVVVLRAVAVIAARWQLAGAGALLAVSNLVTVPALRSVVDAAVGLSLLASTASPPATTTAAPPPVPAAVQAAEAPPTWDRARVLLDAVRTPPTTRPPSDGEAGPAPTEASVTPDRHEATGPLYEVKPGDSLWRIAERELGDGLRWRELWALNRGRDMGDGRSFRHAGLVRPGWVLYLPPHQQPAPATPPSPPVRPKHPGAHTNTPTPPPPTTAPPGTAAPTTSSDRPAPEPSASEPTPAPAPGQHRHGHDVLDLPSGSVVAFALAAGIAFALATARLRRRARRRLGRPDDLAEPEVGDLTRRLARFAHQRTTAHPDDPDDPDDPDEENHQDGDKPTPHVPFAPSDLHTTHPGRVVIAERGGEELAVDLVDFGAITLTGPHAPAAARAAVVALLSSGNPYAAEVILASDTLLAGVDDFPGLRRIPDLADAVDTVERELLGRARLFDSYDAPDFLTMRAEHPDDQQPALLLVCDQPPGEHADRLAALLAQGPRLGIGALLATSSPDPKLDGTARLRLDDAGRIETASPHTLGEGQLVGARILRLSEPEAAELLGVLAASRTDPAEQHPAAVLAPVAEPGAARAVPPARPVPAPAEPPPQPPPPATEAKVRVRLLGAYRIETTAGGEVATGLRHKAREALAYCLLHPDGRTSEQVIDRVFPEVDPARSPQRFWNAMTNIRSVLRQATRVDKLPAVERAGPLYRPDPEVFEVDVWQVQAALRAAHHAADDGELLTALEQVAAGYTANLLESPGYEWAEPLREELRRRAVDALARLAELHHKAGNSERALAVLEQAITADPYAEELYQRIMRLQAALDRPDAVRRTFRIVEERLDELDLDPSDATVQLTVALTRTPRPSRQPSR